MLSMYLITFIMPPLAEMPSQKELKLIEKWWMTVWTHKDSILIE